MLGEFIGQNEAHRSLDLPGGDGRLLNVPRKTGGLLSELFEDVVDEAIHDTHGLAGDSNTGVDLLEHLKDVDLVCLQALLSPLLFVHDSRSAFLL